MFRRSLGHSGIEISALGLGCRAIVGPFSVEQIHQISMILSTT